MSEMSCLEGLGRALNEYSAAGFGVGVCAAFLYDALVSRGVELFDVVVECVKK